MIKCENKKHFSCKNCKRISRFNFKNKVMFCFGLVRKPKPNCDHYRYCIAKGNTRNANDLMKEEVEIMLYGLSIILLTHDVTRKK